MRNTPNLNLTVWDDPNDEFDPDILADNWDKIDDAADDPAEADFIVAVASVPVSGVSQGSLRYLTAASDGFAANTVIRYDGAAWRAVGPLEVLSSLPTQHLFAGRLVLLTSGGVTGFADYTL